MKEFSQHQNMFLNRVIYVSNFLISGWTTDGVLTTHKNDCIMQHGFQIMVYFKVKRSHFNTFPQFFLNLLSLIFHNFHLWKFHFHFAQIIQSECLI